MHTFRTSARRRTPYLAALALVFGGSGLLGAVSAPAAQADAAGQSAKAVAADCPWVRSSAPIADRVAQVLAKMTNAQKVMLTTGTTGSNYGGFTPGIPSLCIPAMTLEDGPAGVADNENDVTQLPAPVSVASTWDTSAEQTYGQAIGAEQAAKGSTVDLGPTINIDRDPRWGRSFESIGEDPYLNGQMGAADIRGVQSAGVMAQVKHLAVYNQETNRNTAADNAVISQKAMQEIYLPAFQTAVQEGAASSVMCSYSTINGTSACQNPLLLDTVLRKQFGFQGFVTSDWGATHSTAASANAGLDQDMSGKDGYFGTALSDAVAAGDVSQATLDGMVGRILTEMFAFGQFDQAPSGSLDAVATTDAHKNTATQIAAEGTVLLKNSGKILPFGAKTSSIAVIGTDGSTAALTRGGGSAQVNSSGTVTPLQGITARAGSGVSVAYDDGSDTASAASLAASSSVAVVFVSKYEGEPNDLSSMDLSDAQNSLVSAVAAANPNTVVVLNTGSAVTMPWINSVKGVMEAWYPGQNYGTAIASLLFGDTNPSGHLPVTFPTSIAQVPASTAAQWPGTNGTVQYSEGVDVGYRYYDAQHLTPLFPFGYGLSYTDFSFSHLKIGKLTAGGSATVTATVTNTGRRKGADIAQLYVTQPNGSSEPKALQGFARVDLAPGQSKTVSFPLTEQNLRTYDESAGTWTTATGPYRISVGDSHDHLPLGGNLNVTKAQLGTPLTVTSPGSQEGLTGRAVSVRVAAHDTTSGQTPVFTATGLPAGTSISSSGTITGTPTAAGTTTVTVTAHDRAGASASTSFVWTVVRADAPLASTLVGYQGLCLDVSGGTTADGTKVDVYACNGTAAQEWVLGADHTAKAYGKCLDVTSAGTADGTKVQLHSCNGTGAQVWEPQSDGTLLNPASGKCLDDTDRSTTAGTQVQIWSCTGAANQVWQQS
ncbi:glycoside hydrolase family 3 C-terminal domain-containing protein [Streptomyces sp. CA2R106]|uniref:glycoside hydrolase family 3 C-terminal domain-containing protein n=1 Tax=Streptomyces sp. CA2R106 TaxID=3120153 RepID=UPI0030083FB1